MLLSHFNYDKNGLVEYDMAICVRGLHSRWV